ncbi:MAG: orotate phosphoribosyltransferase [Candidatus Omnitrophota bacterium]|nr:MAG: orotate phosphoribosyltransferase [Candidatus Omnitrophota bacterium]
MPQVLKIFKDAGALLEGHFLLSSGLHSRQYLQCARVLENPQITARLCEQLARGFKKDKISAVIGPAMGGIILAYELARALGARALFAERESGKMRLRRGFSLSPKDNVLICEDVITTGGSVSEVIEAVKATGAEIRAVCSLADRSRDKIDFGVRLVSLIKLEFETYRSDECPLCKQKIALTKPGSR